MVERPHSPRTRDRRLQTAAILHLGASTAVLIERLRQGGAQSILLRGPVLVDLLYDDELERGYADIDLLVCRASIPTARAILRTVGFARSGIEVDLTRHHPLHAETWIRPQDNLTVDLHRSLIGVAASPDRLWNALWEGHETLSVAGTLVDVPGEHASALVIALHAAQHGPRWNQPLGDLDRALSRLPIETWRAAAGLALECEAAAAFAAGLHLLPRGRAVAQELGLEAAAIPDASLRGGERFHVAQGIQWMLSLDGMLPKARFIARKAFPPPAEMRLRFSVASRGRAGLALAYAARLSRLTWYAGPALYAELRRGG